MKTTTILLATALAFSAGAQTTLCVLDLRPGPGVGPDECAILTERLISEFTNTGSFVVMDRAARDARLDQMAYEQSGMVDATLAQMGKELGVSKMVLGTVGRLGQTWTVTARMIDVNKGQSERGVTRDYRGEIDALLGVMREVAQELSGVAPSTTPTYTPAITPSYPSGPPRGALLFEEMFYDDAVDRWWRGDGYLDDGSIGRSFWFDGVEYVATSYSGGARAWCTSCGTFSNAVYEIEVRLRDGVSDAAAGIAFRLNTESSFEYYLFQMTADAQASFWRSNGDGSWTELVSPTTVNSAKGGMVENTLTVVARGTHFDLYVNGVFFGSADDPIYRSGAVGVYVQIGAGTAATASYDGLRVYALP